jgi:enamine deaminase RidA (YjgF/YER057c/UK114 family)
MPLAALLAACTLTACESSAPPPVEQRVKETFHLREFEKGFGYAQAIKIGRTLYVSGTVSVDAEGRLVGAGDMGAQLRAVYRNLQETLVAHGATFQNVVRENIYTTDMRGLLAVSDLRLEYYARDLLPTGTWVQVQQLVDPGFLVEIELTAEL